MPTSTRSCFLLDRHLSRCLNVQPSVDPIQIGTEAVHRAGRTLHTAYFFVNKIIVFESRWLKDPKLRKYGRARNLHRHRPCAAGQNPGHAQAGRSEIQER